MGILRNCDICNREFEMQFSECNAVKINVYDIKTNRYNQNFYWTCRHCAAAVRAYIDKLSREFRE